MNLHSILWALGIIVGLIFLASASFCVTVIVSWWCSERENKRKVARLRSNKKLILEEFEAGHLSQSTAAELLGVSRQRFQEILHKHSNLEEEIKSFQNPR